MKMPLSGISLLLLWVGCHGQVKEPIKGVPSAHLDSANYSISESMPDQAVSVPLIEPKRVRYSIAETKDVSFGEWRGSTVEKIVRFSYRIRVTRAMSEDEMRNMAMDLVTIITCNQSVNALAFAFYLPDSELPGWGPTAGRAEWAPYGEWVRADNVRAGDYSRHQLRIWNYK